MCLAEDYLLRAGFYGEGRDYDGSTIIQKTHHSSVRIMEEDQYDLAWREQHIRTFAGRGILLIRDPYNAIISYWNFLHTSSPTAISHPQLYESSAFRKFVNTCIDL